MTVKCKKCGAEMADEARFCMNCGAEAEIRMDSTPGEASPPPPPTPAPPVQPKNSNAGKLIFACVVLLAAVLGFTYYFLSGGAPDDIRDYTPEFLHDICIQFLSNQKAAEEKYVGKKVILCGVVEETGTMPTGGKPYVSLKISPYDHKAICVFSLGYGLKDLKSTGIIVRGVIDSISHNGKGDGTITMSQCALCTNEEFAKAYPDYSEVFAEVAKTTKQPTQKGFGVGDKAELNNVAVTLVGVTESRGSQYNKPTDGNVFVLCEFEIENNSRSDISISSMMNFEAYCDDYACDYSVPAMMARGNKKQLDVPKVASGKRFNGVVGYEVPADWKELELKFTPNFFAGKKITFIAVKPFNGGKSSPVPMEVELDDDAAAVTREREDNGDPYFDEELVLIGEVTGSNVRVRAKPYLDAAVTGKVSYGKVLVYESLYRNGKKWFHVMKELKNGDYLNGWMSADFIRIKREGNEKALSQRDDI